ncbi:phage tail tip lysozyme [Nocardia pseudovaccinii]|uniref:phage tail tip lysozyme n=1 Tax=Nocardia pseudovaccinii TaxID=189540 RepID=UPI0007A3C3BE|nr:phage tail tip lysozyme [Nocardia pseudovaccinii]
MADEAVDTSLPSRPDAPILNAFASHIETVLAKLVKAVGDGSAKSITVEGLKGLGESQLKSGELVTKYRAKQSDDTKYRDDLNSLDSNIAQIAAKAADVSITTTREVKELVGDVKDIMAGVPNLTDVPLPRSIELQMTAINKIDKKVEKAAQAVSDAYDALDDQAGKVTDPESDDSGSATNSIGSGNQFPTYTGSGGNSRNSSGPAGLGNSASAQPIGAGQKVTASEIYKYLLSKGFTPAQAAGILGNMQVESGFDTGAYNPGEGAIGLCQWEGGRRTALEAFAANDPQHRSITDWHLQVDFMMHELRGSESGAYGQIKAANSAGAAAAAFDQYYERSSGEARGQRVANANSIASNMASVAA